MIRICDERDRKYSKEILKNRKQFLHMGALTNLVDVVTEKMAEEKDDVMIGVYATALASTMKCIPLEVILGETHKMYLCPACLEMYELDCSPEPYCSHCGQALWWPEEKGGCPPTVGDLLAMEEQKDD